MSLPARVLSHPGRVAAALGARRRLRRLPPMDGPAALEFAQRFQWRGDDIRPTQTPSEILWLMERVAAARPKVVVEIGTDQGGTLFLWTRVAEPDALVVAVDNRPLGPVPALSPYALARGGFARGSQRVKLLMPVDSHDPETVRRLTALLGGRAVDFLFVDGDHSYDGVRSDYEMYSPLVRSGGLIGFHDVGAPTHPGVVRLWQELRSTHRTEEQVDSDLGIGLLHVA